VALLLAVQRIVGRVEIGGDLLVRLDEDIDEQRLDWLGLVADLVIATRGDP